MLQGSIHHFGPLILIESLVWPRFSFAILGIQPQNKIKREVGTKEILVPKWGLAKTVIDFHEQTDRRTVGQQTDNNTDGQIWMPLGIQLAVTVDFWASIYTSVHQELTVYHFCTYLNSFSSHEILMRLALLEKLNYKQAKEFIRLSRKLFSSQASFPPQKNLSLHFCLFVFYSSWVMWKIFTWAFEELSQGMSGGQSNSFPPSVYKGPTWSTARSAFAVILLFSDSLQIIWTLKVVCICISMMASKTECFFHVYWSFFLPYFEKCLLKSSTHMLTRLYFSFRFFFFFRFFFLYILDITPLSVVQLAEVFFPFCRLFLHWINCSLCSRNFQFNKIFFINFFAFPCQVPLIFSFSVFVILFCGLDKLSFVLEALFYLYIWGRVSEIEPKALHKLGKCSTTEFCFRLLYLIIFSNLTSVHYTHISNRNLIIIQKLLISSILHRILFKLFFTFINFFLETSL